MKANLNKKRLRELFIKKRKLLTSKKLAGDSELITKKVLKFLAECQKIGVYIATKGEAETRLIIDSQIACKKQIFVPAYHKSDYKFVGFENWEFLVSGPYGVLQPKNAVDINIEKLDAIVMPGVAFDLGGFRLGYGQGVYDKLLVGYSGLKIGLCFDFQITKTVFPQAHDIRMDVVISEKRVISFT